MHPLASHLAQRGTFRVALRDLPTKSSGAGWDTLNHGGRPCRAQSLPKEVCVGMPTSLFEDLRGTRGRSTSCLIADHWSGMPFLCVDSDVGLQPNPPHPRRMGPISTYAPSHLPGRWLPGPAWWCASPKASSTSFRRVADGCDAPPRWCEGVMVGNVDRTV